MNPVLIVILVYLAGFITRLILPFAIAYVEGETESFDWRKVAGIIIGSFLGFFPTIFTSTFIGELIEQLNPVMVEYGPIIYYIVVYFTAIGAGSFGRDVQKTPGAVRAYRNK